MPRKIIWDNARAVVLATSEKPRAFDSSPVDKTSHGALLRAGKQFGRARADFTASDTQNTETLPGARLRWQHLGRSDDDRPAKSR